jgi:hypothetical protein
MQINLVPDNSVASAPAGFTAAVEDAAAVFEQDFPGDYTINISYGWGTFDNTASSDLTNPNSGVYSLGGGFFTTASYSQVKSWLTAEATSSDQISADATLPASSASFPGDANTFYVSFAEEIALGVFTGNSNAIDGSIGFNIGDASTPQDWEPAALTEIAHALGWDSIAQSGSFPDVADLFRYSSPGQYGWTSGQPEYFSIDGGNTDLADFSTSFDQTLFSDLPTDDPLRLPFTSAATTLTSFDIEALSVIGFGAVSVPSPPPPLRFNAGGSSPDILWQETNGQAGIWEMNGSNVVATAAVGSNPQPSWQVVDTGDFNGDGNPDILWQNTSTGQVGIWEMNGTNVATTAAVGPALGTSWKAIGTGDFNGNGDSDILLQNTSTGQVGIWMMNGTSITSETAIGPALGISWQAIGTGDFNGNGDSDILFQNTATGQVGIWEMNGTTIVSQTAVGSNPDPSWRALGTGDFNHDGRSDILFQNTSTGQVGIWEMNGTNIMSEAAVGSNLGTSWQVVGTGDFNGDGHSDILFQNTNGQAGIWEMNGTNVVATAAVGANPGPTWLAV